MAATQLSYGFDDTTAPILGVIRRFFREPALSLPNELATAVAAMAGREGSSELAVAAAALSQAYRDRGRSSEAVRGAADVSAYLVTRLPATYAAIEAAFGRMLDVVPDFKPRTVLDLGCGPGTASWAATATFESLDSVTMLDANRGLLESARTLASASALPALQTARIATGDLASPPPGHFDLVVLGYALTELPDAGLLREVEAAWSRCSGLLVIVEPGTPRDYERLMRGRRALVDLGGRIAAPCPHQSPCPIEGPDWCHFSIRLPRTRAHQRMKGGSLGYEDEKFSYLAVARPHVRLAPPLARVLARPRESKFDLALKLCEADGRAVETRVMKRDRDAYRAVRKLGWGGAIGSPTTSAAGTASAMKPPPRTSDVSDSSA
jgi:ribosomal protein RSM22 (predicted rRNA methylase)